MKGPATSRRPDGGWLQSNDELRSDPWLQQLFQADESSKREAKKGLEEFRKLFQGEPALKAKFPLWPPDISDFHEPSFWGLQQGLCFDLWASDHADCSAQVTVAQQVPVYILRIRNTSTDNRNQFIIFLTSDNIRGSLALPAEQ